MDSKERNMMKLCGAWKHFRQESAGSAVSDLVSVADELSMMHCETQARVVYNAVKDLDRLKALLAKTESHLESLQRSFDQVTAENERFRTELDAAVKSAEFSALKQTLY